jgi:hypothetical protein
VRDADNAEYALSRLVSDSVAQSIPQRLAYMKAATG